MAEKKSDILSSDGLHLKMMSDGNGISVDKELPKYSIIREEVEARSEEHTSELQSR